MTKLLIDTATKALILALEDHEEIKGFVYDLTQNDHSERLMPEIEQLFLKSSLSITDVDAFYIGMGPGSYTGVRIGVTVAKMFAYTLNKPLYAISSLGIIALPYIDEAKYIVPIIDARRNNVFATIYKTNHEDLTECIEEKLYQVDELIAIIKDKQLEDVLFVGLDTAHFSTVLEANGMAYKGDCQKDFKPSKLFSQLNFKFVDDIHAFAPNYKRVTEAERNLHARL